MGALRSESDQPVAFVAVSAELSEHRAQAAAQIRRLNDLVVFGDLGSAELDLLRSEGQRLADRFEVASRPGWWKEPDTPSVAYRRRSPFSGVENPWSPGMTIEIVEDSDATRAIGEVELTKAFGGPPGAAHGGVVAGLFDEVVGALAPSLLDGLPVTAKLSISYRRPTPLHTLLRLEAGAERHGSRRARISARCWAGDLVTATAEALMVSR